MTDEQPETTPTRTRGFASMDPATQRALARKGGQIVHQKGTAHEWTSAEARAAGRTGGLVSQARRRAARTARSTDNAAGR